MPFAHRSYNGPQYRHSPEHKGSSQRNCSRGPPVSPGLEFEDESHSKYVSDVGRNKNYEMPEDSEVYIHREILLPAIFFFVHERNVEFLTNLFPFRQFAQIFDEPEMYCCQLLENLLVDHRHVYLN